MFGTSALMDNSTLRISKVMDGRRFYGRGKELVGENVTGDLSDDCGYGRRKMAGISQWKAGLRENSEGVLTSKVFPTF